MMNDKHRQEETKWHSHESMVRVFSLHMIQINATPSLCSQGIKEHNGMKKHKNIEKYYLQAHISYI